MINIYKFYKKKFQLDREINVNYYQFLNYIQLVTSLLNVFE